MAERWLFALWMVLRWTHRPSRLNLATIAPEAYRRDVSSELQRENARIYTEMFEEGIEPFRGTWRSVTVMIVFFVLTMLAMVIGFAMVVATPEAFLHDIAPHIFISPFASGWALVEKWLMFALGIVIFLVAGYTAVVQFRARHRRHSA